MGTANLLAELARRNVIRVAGLYLVAAWLTTQVAGTVLPMFGAPGWVARSVVILLAIGFLPALGVAWIFELTPQGLKRDADVAPQASLAPQTGRRMDRLIIVVLAIALLFFGVDRCAHAPATPSKPAAPAVAAPLPSVAPSVASQSVAVLPFVNMSGEPDNDYFSDGITEEILNALAQVPGLKVAARTSAFAFKGKTEDLRKVGRVLGVATVLEGSVQRAGDQMRITAQLIDTRSGYHLWSEKYDRKLTNIFAVEDEISSAIAERLKVQWSGTHPGGRRAPVDSRAHDFYLRGLTLFAKRSMPEAVDAFERAVALDPGYAQAWASLAEARAILPTYAENPAQGAGQDALDAASQALSLDPGQPQAYVAQGIVFLNRMRWADADDAFRRAVAVAPGDAEAINQYAQFLYAVGQLRPALAEIERSLRRDPLSGPSGAIRAQLLTALHRPEEGMIQLRRTLATHPEGLLEHRVAFWILAAQGDYREAGRHLRIASELMDGRPDLIDVLVRGMIDPASRAAAIRTLETDPALGSLRSDAVVHASFLMALSDRAGALAALEHFAGDGISTTPQLLWYPVFDPLRGDPRFQAVLARIGLPYAAKPLDSP